MVLATRVASRLPGGLFLVTGAAVLAIALAGSVSVPADSLNIVAPYWWIPLLLVLVAMAWLVRRRRFPALLLLAGCGIVGMILFAPLLPAAASTNALPTVRIVSFNMYRSNPRAGEVAAWVLKQRPDFVVLLEASPDNHRAVERLKEQLPYVYNCSPSGYCSTMIFAREPAKDVWPLARGDADNRRAISALTARFDAAGATLPITAVHLSHPWPLGDQASQLDELGILVGTVGRHGIMSGDFNSAPWTFAMRRLANTGELELASGGAGTWPSGNPAALRLPLDQVYLGRCLLPVAVRRGPALGSDHLPVVADIAIGRCNG